MRYRVIEINSEESEFFVQTGIVHKERIWWGFYKKVISWDFLRKDDEPIKYNSFHEAILAINELKKREPIYHNIK